MGAVRNLTAWLADVAHAIAACRPRTPRVAPRPSDDMPAPQSALAAYQELRRNDPLVRRLLKAAGLPADPDELGTAVLNPDTAEPAHRPDSTRPLDLTACGLSRRRLSWTAPLSTISLERRCATCYPVNVEV